MNQAQFNVAIGSVPVYYAVFRVKAVPPWNADEVSVGDLMYWNHHRGSLFKISSGMDVMVEARALEFIGHWTAAMMGENL